tara:strand:+ start:463 stop:1185 length:723 start_codon:yes stop_codon:yes gene_type:complete
MNNKNYKLILDSSTKETLVGISKESDVISEKSWVSNNNESRTLLPNIKNIIETNNIEFDNISEINIVIGPGGFSSLRIGLSIAKSMSIAKGIKIIPIPSLMVAAWDHINNFKNIISIIKCSKTTYYLKDYSNLTAEEIINEKEYNKFEVVDITKIKEYFENGYSITSYDRAIFEHEDKILNSKVLKTKSKINSIIAIGDLIKQKYTSLNPTSINPIYANSGQIESALKVKQKGVKNWKKH